MKMGEKQLLLDTYGPPEEFGKVELLDPDLQDWVTVQHGMTFIKHPLLVELFTSPTFANGIYAKKRELYEKRLAASDYDGALQIIERPFRLEYLSEWWKNAEISRGDLREMLPGWWTDAEPNDAEIRWRLLWRDAVKVEGPVLQKRLPKGDTIKVFRGTRDRADRLGIAWSTDRSTAVFFANRMSLGQPGWIVRGEVRPQHVMAYLTDRGESEIVVDPRRVVRITWEQEGG